MHINVGVYAYIYMCKCVYIHYILYICVYIYANAILFMENWFSETNRFSLEIKTLRTEATNLQSMGQIYSLNLV